MPYFALPRSSAGWRDATPTSRRRGGYQFRIGVNLGDVIVEENDIFGDGVNVAARLEMLAEPGGICVSGAVRDQVGDRLEDIAFEDLGEQSVKNIAVRSMSFGSGLTSTHPPRQGARGMLR